MPTNEERRKVAARLRNYENLRESFRESPICAFLNALGVEYLDWKGVCNHLADLIEPEPERTCEIESFDNGLDEDYDGSLYSYAPPTYYLSCGHEAYQYKPNYCPDCGAKVK